jgi:hypothetical protein
MVALSRGTGGTLAVYRACWLVDSERLGHGMDAYDPEYEQDKHERQYARNEPSEAQGS